MVLLTIFISTTSILMGNLLQEFISSDASEADRKWIWQYYGTAYHSFKTIYEITFAGGLDGICAWLPQSRGHVRVVKVSCFSLCSPRKLADSRSTSPLSG